MVNGYQVGLSEYLKIITLSQHQINVNFFLVRPDVLKELLRYPEVFFIRDVRKPDNSLEVCMYICPFKASITLFVTLADDSRTESGI